MKRLLFSIITLLLTILIIEGFARLFPTKSRESQCRNVTATIQRIWSMTPGTQEQFGATVTIDSLGMLLTQLQILRSGWWLVTLLLVMDSMTMAHFIII